MLIYLVIGIVIGGVVSGVAAYFIINARSALLRELRRQMTDKETELTRLSTELANLSERATRAETLYEQECKNQTKLKEAFDSLSLNALRVNSQEFLKLAQQIITEAKGELANKQESVSNLIKPLQEALDKYERQTREMESKLSKDYGGVEKYLGQLSQINQDLQQETRNLVTALKTPQVKGRWGEMTLRRLVELAGLTRYCDFEEQVSVETEEGRRRPDLTVYLPGKRVIIVDAKAPLTAYMEAQEAPTEAERKNGLLRHARLVRNHMQSLCSKAYWTQFEATPDFVVLFLPGESFFSAALEQDRTLIEDGMKSRVILATPTTLMALLRTVAYTWQQQDVSENATRIAETGRELYERVTKFMEHLLNIREGIIKAAESYNEAVGSLEHRVLPTARRFKELGAAPADKEIPLVEPVDTYLRQLPATDSTD